MRDRAQPRARARALSALCAPLTRIRGCAHARRLGMMWALDVDDAGRGFVARATTSPRCAQGLLLRPIGTTLYFMPPYVIDDEALGQLARARARRGRRMGSALRRARDGGRSRRGTRHGRMTS